MKKFIWFLLVIFCSFFITHSSAFSQESKKLSLKDCIETALEKNSQLKNAERDIKLANTDITTTRSALLPNINAYFSSGRYIQGERRRKTDVPVGVDPETGDILYEQKDIIQAKIERNSHYASLQLNQRLWDWGRSWYRLAQTKLLRKSREFTLSERTNFVIYNVQEKYFELLKAIKLGKVYEEAVKRSEEQLNRIQSMYDIGSVALADVYKARVALGNDKINLINQKNTINISKANLTTAMGIDPGTPIDIEEMEAEDLSIPYTFNSALETSLEQNPDLKNFELNVKNYQYEKRIAKLAYLPELSGSIRYSRDNEYFNRVYDKNLDENYTVSLGLQVDLNIFNGFADKAEVSRQSINYAKAREDLIEKKRLLKADVTQAFNVLKANKEIVEINATNLQSSQEDVRLAEERYKIGAGTLLEVIDAQLALTQAKSTLVSAKYNYQIASTYLKYIMNELGY